MIHVATVPRDPSTSIGQVHAMLYSYFPGAAQGERPFVWRLLAADRVAVVSATPSSALDRRAVRLEAGATYAFELAMKAARNADRDQPRGGRRQGEVESTAPAQVRGRLARYAAERGIAVGFSRVTLMAHMGIASRGRRIPIPVAHVKGLALVTDADAAERMIAAGGPGTGKAWGLGLWWLPELMAGPARLAA